MKRSRTLVLCTLLLLVPFSEGATANELTDALIAYVRQDHPRAVEKLTVLADQHDATAQATLGHIYSTGNGAPRDNVAALKWFGLAAAQGHAEAQFRLGEMHRDGLGTQADGKLALIWFMRAADQGLPHAFNAVGELYAGDSGLPPDDAAALDWFRNGAAEGSAAAMYNLGIRYALGKGVTVDAIEAHKWFGLAADAAAGSERDKAERARMTLAETLTPVEVGAANARAAEWLRLARAAPAVHAANRHAGWTLIFRQCQQQRAVAAASGALDRTEGMR